MIQEQRTADELVRRIKAGKAAIRRHRAELASAKAALDELQRECARRGIRLIVQTTGEEETHGQHVRAAS